MCRSVRGFGQSGEFLKEVVSEESLLLCECGYIFFFHAGVRYAALVEEALARRYLAVESFHPMFDNVSDICNLCGSELDAGVLLFAHLARLRVEGECLLAMALDSATRVLAPVGVLKTFVGVGHTGNRTAVSP